MSQPAKALLLLGSRVLTRMESELLGPCYKTGSQITHKQRVLREFRVDQTAPGTAVPHPPCHTASRVDTERAGASVQSFDGETRRKLFLHPHDGAS